MFRFRFRYLVPAVVALALGASQLATSSAQPATSTLTAGATSLQLSAWRLSADPSATSLVLCDQGVNCEARSVDVAVSPELYRTGDRLMTVHLGWSSKSDDLDLYVCRTSSTSFRACLNDLVGSSSRRGTRSETVRVIDPRPGTYRVVVAAVQGSPSYSLNAGMSTPRAPSSATTTPVRSSDGSFSWYATPVSDQSSFGEPSIDVDHSGGIYITAPGGAGVQMWRSFNGGKTFDHKEISSPNGGGDSEVDFNSTDVGFTADLEITDSAVSRSTNRFKSWDQQPVGIEQDRQWLENKCDKQMFLVYHDFVAETVDLNRSDDGGKTWDTAPTPVTNDGDAPGSQDVVEGADQGANTFQGPMAVNQQNGDVYIVFAISSAQGNVTTGVPPYGDPEQIVVASSHDNGKTFDLHLVQGGGPGEAAGEIFPWITLDKAGTVYVSYAYRAKDTDPLNIVMTHSKDRGQTWSKPAVVNTDNTSGSHIYSTISAGDPGKVDVAWYTGDKIDPSNTNQDWHVDFAQVTNADTTNPTVHQSRPYPDRIHHGDVCLNGLLCILGGDRSLLDFFQVQVGENGMANIAFDNNGSPDNTRRVWYARQTSGPGIGNALHDSQYCGQSPSGGGGGGGGGALPGPHVRLHLSDRTPARNTTVKFHTRLGRCTGNANTTIDLQKDTKGKFVTIDKTKLNKRCRATFKLKAAFKKGRFRTYWPKQSRKYRAGRSKPRTVTTH